MKLIKKTLTLLILITFFGCGQNAHDMNVAKMEAKSAMSPPAADNAAVSVERKLIKEGEIEFETEDINSSRQLVLKAINHFGGYVATDQESKEPGKKINTITVRIPSEKFDAFISEATTGISTFEKKDIRVKDVTEEFLDVEARLKTKKALESRFSELLKQTKSVIEILEIEKQMAQLRSDIESIEGRLKFLQSQVSLSTLSFTFYEMVPGQTAFGQKFKTGFKNGWDNLIWFFVFLVNLWPFVLIIIIVIYFIKYIRRKKRNAAVKS